MLGCGTGGAGTKPPGGMISWGRPVSIAMLSSSLPNGKLLLRGPFRGYPRPLEAGENQALHGGRQILGREGSAGVVPLHQGVGHTKHQARAQVRLEFGGEIAPLL